MFVLAKVFFLFIPTVFGIALGGVIKSVVEHGLAAMGDASLDGILAQIFVGLILVGLGWMTIQSLGECWEAIFADDVSAGDDWGDELGPTAWLIMIASAVLLGLLFGLEVLT